MQFQAELFLAGGMPDWRVLLMFGGVMAVMIFLPRWARRNSNARQRRDHEIQQRSQDTLKVKSEADRILLDLVEAGQTINAQLDTKMRVLNGLIRDAEKIADRLDRAANNVANAAKIVEHQCAATVVLPLPEISESRIDETASEINLLDNSIASMSPMSNPFSRDARNPNNANNNRSSESTMPLSIRRSESGRFSARAKIFELHRLGKDPREIAREMQMSLSEINLALDFLSQMSR